MLVLAGVVFPDNPSTCVMLGPLRVATELRAVCAHIFGLGQSVVFSGIGIIDGVAKADTKVVVFKSTVLEL